MTPNNGDEGRCNSDLTAGDELRIVFLERAAKVRPELMLVDSSIDDPGAGNACCEELDNARDDWFDDWSALIFNRLRLITYQDRYLSVHDKVNGTRRYAPRSTPAVPRRLLSRLIEISVL